ncbi:MAG TPA: T9SS type A sorting domain-containing protein [Flavobacteriales bacterium]|nr:T9SS type A sorting domain-containing protein [Flavobacteriales bacterium]
MSIAKFCSGLLLAMTCHVCAAQYYPDSNAVWCLWTAPFDPGYNIQLRMGAEPDTLILGQAYKKITEHNDFGGVWNSMDVFYVRNGEDGKGYMFLLDSMAEYVTGDVNAVAGDTVHDVIIRTPNSYFLRDLVVDSVVALSNGGVDVVRHYAELTFGPTDFWQAGAGAATGPCLVQPGLAGYLPLCIVGRDTVQYNIENTDQGLPGGPPCCADFALGSAPSASLPAEMMQVHPNPSSGPFYLLGTMQLFEAHVFDTQGRLLFRTNRREIDLSEQAPGLYTALVQYSTGQQTFRLVVAR